MYDGNLFRDHDPTWLERSNKNENETFVIDMKTGKPVPFGNIKVINETEDSMYINNKFFNEFGMHDPNFNEKNT
jgi:hypothetical protein